MAQLHKKLHSFLAGILPKTFIFRLDFWYLSVYYFFVAIIDYRATNLFFMYF